MSQASEGGEMWKTGANDGHSRLYSGPDEQRSHHPGNVGAVRELMDEVNSYDTGNTSTVFLMLA